MYIALLLKDVYGESLRPWLGQFIQFCQKNQCPLITNKEFCEYSLRFSAYEMERYELDPTIRIELGKIDTYYVPDEFYGAVRGMTTEASLNLFGEEDEVFENYLLHTVAQIEKKYYAKVEGILHFGHGYYGLEQYAKKYGCKVIRMELSSIRKMHEYTQSLYWATMDAQLLHSKQCEERYDNFCKEGLDVPLFTRAELIALFGKESTLPLIPLMNAEPEYELGICESKYRIDPHCFVNGRKTDDDLYFESRKYFEQKQIVKRPHPDYYTQVQRLENRKNPENFILSCRRSATIGSNTMFLTMLWNRTACCLDDILSCAFKAEKDFSSEKIVDLKFLNFLIFGYFVPGSENIFSTEYWEWRYTYPAETEIYKKHMNICLAKAGVDESILKMSGIERLATILDARNCDEALKLDIIQSVENADEIKKENVKYQVATSELIVNGKKFYCRNHFDGDEIISSFHIRNRANTPVRFVPLGDIAGGVEINEVTAMDSNGNIVFNVQESIGKYYQKNEQYAIDLGKLEELDIRIVWKYKNVSELLEGNAFYFSTEKDIADECHILLSSNNGYLMQAVVSINSILANNTDLKLHFHIFHKEISETDQKTVLQWIEEKESEVQLSFHKIPVEDYVFPIKPGDAVSEETYFRILAPDFLPADVDRVLYVDCDTVTVGSLRELFQLDLTGKAVACAKGGAPQERKDSLGLRVEDQYYQAGVTLINLAYWRKYNISKKVLDFIADNIDILPRWDQDALNAVLVGRYQLLPQKWNTFVCDVPREQKFDEEPIILHYTGFHQHKPWWKNTLSLWQDIFLEYKKGTPYADMELQWYVHDAYQYEETLLATLENVILYGAGNVGKDFYDQNRRKGWCNIVAWADKNYKKYEKSVFPVQKPKCLFECEYEYVLIAVERERLADEIKNEMIAYGVDEEKIIWLKPECI